MSRFFSWCLVVVWAAWLFGLQGLFASSSGLASWTPDLGICLLLALDPRLERSEALLTVALVSGTRVAFSSDPAVAILVGYAALVAVARRLRRVVEVDRGLPRAFLAAAFALLLELYWGAARGALLAATPGLGGAAGPAAPGASRLLHVALATALAAAVLPPLLLRLPGMSPLRRRP